MAILKEAMESAVIGKPYRSCILLACRREQTNKRLTYMRPIRLNAFVIVGLCFLAMTFPNIANGQNRTPLQHQISCAK